MSKLQPETRAALANHLKDTGGKDCQVRVVTATNTRTGEVRQGAECNDHNQRLR